MIEEWCGKGQGSIRGGTAQNITKILWPKYRSAAHLWAAHFMLQDADFPAIAQGHVHIHARPVWNGAMVSSEQAFVIEPKHGRKGEAILSPNENLEIPPEFVPRTKDGRPANFCWTDDLDAHDLRKKGRPPFLEPP